MKTGTLFTFACASLLIGCVDALPEAGDEATDDIEQPSICGTRNDAQQVNSYNGTLGPTTAFVASHRGPVGAMETTAAANSSKYCSGSLIATNLFLTAGHCVDASTVGDFVSFNFERVAGGTMVLTQTHAQITAIVEDSPGGLDYAIVRLAGTPGATFGVAAVAAADAPVGEAITIIGHPNGEPKQIEAGTVASRSTDYLRYGNVDTLGGSSGSGILNAAGQIVGVHTNGGCTSTGGTNSGVRIARIRAVSGTL